jgi:transposase
LVDKTGVRASDDGAQHRAIISSAAVAAIGTRRCVLQGPRLRRPGFALVPRLISTGDRTTLGKIHKRGNRYLRILSVQAAWAVLIWP